MKSNLPFNIMILNYCRSFLDLYNSFDKNFKRCIYIDLFSILFIILPNHFFLTKRKLLVWFSLLSYLLITADGKEEKLLIDKNFTLPTQKRTSII